MNTGTALRHRATLCIPADHPCLPGHFPGLPVVPGVVILGELLALARTWLGAELEVEALPQAKFGGSLPPGVSADALLEQEGPRLRFRVELAGRTLAQGWFQLHAGHAPRQPESP